MNCPDGQSPLSQSIPDWSQRIEKKKTTLTSLFYPFFFFCIKLEIQDCSQKKTHLKVGTGLVGEPACGDLMKLQMKVDDQSVTSDVRWM
ncbi:hypothetical protein CROQUDRAFT_297735 [Cronartium quercuum f. sp. fusiforme G11]|uniref:NIF system FeS cluster assembly NifU N-terminal domain-containing protein n=1 Tax=Cronartium quercuum f. sp. fusiforme G11 TaxID=708437 RepID=A0A9P6N915_9BASI|nr:hypothetical protein CROQUDRAFT_297735 [Cronartium quercuum f. sp. fusiforme G11]